MASVWIIGCGYVGAALSERLAGEGHEVIALRRREAPLPPGVRLVRADVTRPETLSALPDSVDWVVYAVGAERSSEEAYRQAYVEGLRNVIAALHGKRAQPRRVIVATSTAVYGQDAGEWIDEGSETNPTRFQGRVLLESEGVALSSGLRATVVRFGGIYGPGRTRLIDQVARGEATIPAAANYTNRIHRDDCAGALHHLLKLGEAEPIYLGVDHEPADYSEVVVWLAQRLDAPASPMEIAGDRAAAVTTRGKRCRNDRLVASGYRFVYPTFREGYDRLLDVVRRPHPEP